MTFANFVAQLFQLGSSEGREGQTTQLCWSNLHQTAKYLIQNPILKKASKFPQSAACQAAAPASHAPKAHDHRFIENSINLPKQTSNDSIFAQWRLKLPAKHTTQTRFGASSRNHGWILRLSVWSIHPPPLIWPRKLLAILLQIPQPSSSPCSRSLLLIRADNRPWKQVFNVWPAPPRDLHVIRAHPPSSLCSVSLAIHTATAVWFVQQSPASQSSEPLTSALPAKVNKTLNTNELEESEFLP